MNHRHLTADAGFSLPAIDDILDRGLPEHWVDLRNEVLRDPYGTVANDVLRICAQHHMYGTSRLWADLISMLRLAAASSAKKEPQHRR